MVFHSAVRGVSCELGGRVRPASPMKRNLSVCVVPSGTSLKHTLVRTFLLASAIRRQRFRRFRRCSTPAASKARRTASSFASIMEVFAIG
jgi:hypothetical protein